MREMIRSRERRWRDFRFCCSSTRHVWWREVDDSSEERNEVEGKERRRFELLNSICGHGLGLKR